ncbi:hypothetical protein F511_37666 [Dorcoceras hygrometricum]|uniref:Uncharacterized protein n=1 Tax=Dorcoceras hygrometricum TaxID=472368 RepID=A0A2Z7CWG4_9LAMI|nr:hypothetical protein F511_37666 [Dorcoceras hygrometricum]
MARIGEKRVPLGSSSNADVDFKRWYFSCDGQQRALRDSEATKFCEQELATAFCLALGDSAVGVLARIQLLRETSCSTMFCEQEPAVGFASVFLSGYRNYVVLISWNDNVLSGALGIPGFTAGRGFNPDGGAPGGS